MVLRSEKGSELTHDELDNNFIELSGKIGKRIKIDGNINTSRIKVLDLVGDNWVNDSGRLATREFFAEIIVNGSIVDVKGDGYGNIVDDGYGTPVTSTILANAVAFVSFKDDRYGNNIVVVKKGGESDSRITFSIDIVDGLASVYMDIANDTDFNETVRRYISLSIATEIHDTSLAEESIEIL